MALHTPLFMQPTGGDPDITYTAAELRRFLAVMPPWDGCYLDANPNAYLVQQRAAGANFSVDVGSGTAHITGDDVANQQSYVCWSDSTYNLTTPGAPASGTRTHRVVLQIRDKLNNGAWSTYDFVPVLVQDTGGGFPPEPNSALTIASVSIAAGQSSVTSANITDLRVPNRFRTVSKTSLTSRSSNSVLADPDLQMVLGAGTWKIRAFLALDGGSTTDIQFGWTTPGGTTGSWGGSWHQAGTSAMDQHGHGSWASTDSIVTNGSGTDSYVPTLITGMMTLTASGLVTFNWGTVNAGSAALHSGTFLEAERVS